MSRKLYTRSHNVALVRQVDDDGNLFTADEHSWLTEHEDAEHFQSYESLMSWYMRANFYKLGALGFLIDWLRKEKARAILSLGAGPAVLEHLIQMGLEPGVQVVATDFDKFMVAAAQRLLPNIRAVTFDLFNDNLADIETELSMKFDTAVFFGSSYVLDDPQFVGMFADLAAHGMRTIIDFQAGFLTLRRQVGSLPWARAAKRLLGRELAASEYPGKFHGYARTRREMRRLYGAAGLHIKTELSVGGYPYVAICTVNG
jgi:SAM-dependent methyltransferase